MGREERSFSYVVVPQRVGLSIDFASIPWPFLPTRVRDLLTRRLRVTLPDDGTRDRGLGAENS